MGLNRICKSCLIVRGVAVLLDVLCNMLIVTDLQSRSRTVFNSRNRQGFIQEKWRRITIGSLLPVCFWVFSKTGLVGLRGKVMVLRSWWL